MFCILLIFLCELVESLISCVKNKVGTNHYEIQYIEEKNVPLRSKVCHISLVQKLGCNSCYVAEEDEAKKIVVRALYDFITLRGQEAPKDTIIVISRISGNIC